VAQYFSLGLASQESGWHAVIVRALEIENDAECRIDSVHLVEAEESNALA